MEQMGLLFFSTMVSLRVFVRPPFKRVVPIQEDTMLAAITK